MPTGLHTGGAFDQLQTIQSPQQPIVISGQPSTVTLLPSQTGAIILFDNAAGITYTLPPPAPGLNFSFVITKSITSNSAKVVTDAGTTFLQGSVWSAVAAGTGTEFIANGTTHRAITQNGALTGGLLGTQFWLTCVTGTVWQVSGTVLASGVNTTPFATS